MQTRNSQLSTLNSQLGRVADGNPTAEAIVRRLPDKPLLTARDVADALNLSDTRLVANAVDTGTIRAVKVGKRYRISRDEAARWIRTLEAAR